MNNFDLASDTNAKAAPTEGAAFTLRGGIKILFSTRDNDAFTDSGIEKLHLTSFGSN